MAASELFVPVSAQIERAWNLLTVLIRLGRPACPAELASRCTLLPSPSPDQVQFLCRIPGSPLFLTDDLFVTVSEVAILAFREFMFCALTPFMPRVPIRVLVQKREWGDVSLMYVRKRKALSGNALLDLRPRAKRKLLLPRDVEELMGHDPNQHQLSLVNKIQGASADVLVHLSAADMSMRDYLSVNTSAKEYTSRILKQEKTMVPFLLNSNVVLPSFAFKKIDRTKGESETEKECENAQAIVMHREITEIPSNRDSSLDIDINSYILKAITVEKCKTSQPDIGPIYPDKGMDKSILWKGTWREESYSHATIQLPVQNEMTATIPFSLEAEKERNVSFPGADTPVVHDCHAAGSVIMENAVDTSALHCQSEGASLNADVCTRDLEKSVPTVPTALKEIPAVPLSSNPSTVRKQRTKPFDKPKFMDGLAPTVGLQSLSLDNRREEDSPKQQQAKRCEKYIPMKQKLKRSHIHNMPAKENRVDAMSKGTKRQEPKLLPDFESFVIEEEEGSGGYGTVYRAQRKKDGKIFAVKCPHANAHSHHVNNELKMLDRLGGRNFVIKYEGSFRSGDSVCCVLEHVEHDRPEVLKKEIDVFELQWYGYCMFRALASLHKQGIVHRDVKPGNFLFSRKLSKGYLIDFNLAMDLHQKFGTSSKNQTTYGDLDQNSLSNLKSASCAQARIENNDEILDIINKEAANDSKKPLVSKNLKKRANRSHVNTFQNVDNRNNYGSQAADVSGVTSAKDATSTRTPSGDRLRQPMPYKGRKELINFVHETMQSPNHKAMTVPASQRKRVAAPPGKMDRRLVILTPMPLHSGSVAIAGSGMLKNRGNGKHKREGPCVGTKGFRAPEVLFKSYHQGCKMDIWSAGVTLLYLMIGRTPFGGDPEQNIKEITKLRGSEDMWEVAKLHNCESSYPPELFDVHSLHSMELRDWCMTNTRRPEFFELVPQPLFDLVDKCLTVNPRLRITAEEALMHEFFTPCHESLRKQRMLRRAAGSECGSSSL